MKIRILLSAAFFCIAGFINTVSAQDNLKALMIKCENMDDVSISIVHQRDRETKETKQIVKSFSFTNNKALADEFLNAMQKDKDEAIQAIETKHKGKVIPSYYQFADGDYDVAYSISVSNNGADASISVIQTRARKR